MATADNADQLSKTLCRHLAKGDVKRALRLIDDKKNQDCITEQFSVIVTDLCSYLTDENIARVPDLVTNSETVLVKIADSAGVAEDMFLSLLEFVDEAELDGRFLVLLRPLSNTVLRCEKQALYLEWALNAILQRVHELPLPEDHNLEGEERKLLDADPDVERITSILPPVVSFSVTFASAACLKKGFLAEGDAESAEALSERDTLVGFALHLLGRPLAFLDLEVCEHPGVTRDTAERLVSTLVSLVSPMMWLRCAEVRELAELKKKRSPKPRLSVEEDDGDVDQYYADPKCLRVFGSDHVVSNQALAVLAYLVLAEGVKLDLAPHVYHPVYITRRCFYLANSLLSESSSNIVVRKGLLLAASALSRIADGRIPCSDLESPVQKTFCQALINVIIYSTVKETRVFGLDILHKYLSKFDDRGRFQLFSELHKMTNHSGLKGELAMRLKNTVAEGSSYFRGARLAGLLSQYCSLPRGMETDLVQHADEVISCLNLLRFLVLRDRDGALGLRRCIVSLCDGYMSQLHTAVDVSRAHYRVQLQQGAERATLSEENVSVTVSGQELPAVRSEDEKRACMEALTVFDLIGSLCARVTECFEMRE